MLSNTRLCSGESKRSYDQRRCNFVMQHERDATGARESAANQKQGWKCSAAASKQSPGPSRCSARHQRSGRSRRACGKRWARPKCEKVRGERAAARDAAACAAWLLTLAGAQKAEPHALALLQQVAMSSPRELTRLSLGYKKRLSTAPQPPTYHPRPPGTRAEHRGERA